MVHFDWYHIISNDIRVDKFVLLVFVLDIKQLIGIEKYIQELLAFVVDVNFVSHIPTKSLRGKARSHEMASFPEILNPPLPRFI